MAEVQIHIRPYHELNTPMLQVSRGCTYGKCRFCSIYHEKFAPIPYEEMLVELEQVAAKATALTNRIYLTGGNPFALPTHRLEQVFDAVEERISSVKSYGGFCRIADIAHKTDEELARLASRGVSDLAIGVESGCDETLDFIQKGYSGQDVVEQAARLRAAGITYSFNYLAGLAGTGKGQQNAIDSAAVFSAASPVRIMIFTLSPTKSWPLAEDIAAGRWTPSGEKEVMREIQTFIRNLTCSCSVNCSHDTDIIKFEGVVPDNQALMIELLDHRIEKMNEAAAGKLRELVLGGKWCAQ